VKAVAWKTVHPAPFLLPAVYAYYEKNLLNFGGGAVVVA